MSDDKWTNEEIRKWIDKQTWYQKIHLSSGLETPGSVDCKKRLALLKDAQISGKNILDIGCNSGYYCLWAKKQGAARVVGIDIDEYRLGQARTLAEIEGIDIEYYLESIFEVAELGHFDTVFCFAVLTEIPDLLGSLQALTAVIGNTAYVEIALAKPVLYLSKSKYWLQSFLRRKYSRHILEMRPSKRGWMLSPSFGAVQYIIGSDFKVSYLGKGPRYEMISIKRIR